MIDSSFAACSSASSAGRSSSSSVGSAPASAPSLGSFDFDLPFTPFFFEGESALSLFFLSGDLLFFFLSTSGELFLSVLSFFLDFFLMSSSSSSSRCSRVPFLLLLFSLAMSLSLLLLTGFFVFPLVRAVSSWISLSVDAGSVRAESASSRFFFSCSMSWSSKSRRMLFCMMYLSMEALLSSRRLTKRFFFSMMTDSMMSTISFFWFEV